MKAIKIQMGFDMLVTLMKKNHGVVICRDGPSVEITLQEGDHPHDLEEALSFVEREWDTP